MKMFSVPTALHYAHQLVEPSGQHLLVLVSRSFVIKCSPYNNLHSRLFRSELENVLIFCNEILNKILGDHKGSSRAIYDII